MITINKYIYSILSQDFELKSLVGDNIFSLIIPENKENPVVLIEHLSNSREYVKNQKVVDKTNIVIYSVADDYVSSVDIAARIDAILDCYELETEDFKMLIRQTNTAEAYSGDYIQRIEYTVTINYKN